ncbi:hypothetical protein FOL47_003587 [Perkinsus chesapeaki]|uniref:RNA-binding S4 domain-containing protein n=1 Tax=Perkinsus chesapeaki TaxID=330153 RepID=A0A7J6M7K6_PERCH|nr:hypothetical protein FOL47_003587 [Perkinsus chesapeaki]
MTTWVRTPTPASRPIDVNVPKVVINAANVIHDYAQNCLGLGERTSNWNGARECLKYFRACKAEVKLIVQHGLAGDIPEDIRRMCDEIPKCDANPGSSDDLSTIIAASVTDGYFVDNDKYRDHKENMALPDDIRRFLRTKDSDRHIYYCWMDGRFMPFLTKSMEDAGFLSPWSTEVREACAKLSRTTVATSSSSEESDSRPLTSRRRTDPQPPPSDGALMSVRQWKVVAPTATLWVDPPCKSGGGHLGRSYRDRVPKGTIITRVSPLVDLGADVGVAFQTREGSWVYVYQYYSCVDFRWTSKLLIGSGVFDTPEADNDDLATCITTVGTQSGTHTLGLHHGCRIDIFLNGSIKATGGVALSRLLALEGFCSRREAKSFVELGHVKVDGTVVTDGALVVGICGLAESIPDRSRHYASCQAEMYHKPSARRLLTPAQRWEGCETNHDPRQLRKLLIAGRLDSDSSGLLVYTQDGRVAKTVSDRNSEAVVYWACGRRKGMFIDGRQVGGCEASRIDVNDDALPRLAVIIRSQALARQLQRMLGQCGISYMYLHRTRIGGVRLGDLPAGRWRTLGRNESF